jgi:hypothetical protein
VTDLVLKAGVILRDATISEDGTYRYRLYRRWGGDGPALRWVMLNPSTADGAADDPTIRAVMRFSNRAGYWAAVVCNLYALRATDPRDLGRHADPLGPRNLDHLRVLADGARFSRTPVVVAWGANAPRDWAADVLRNELGDVDLVCLGVTRAGHPRHPCRLAANTPLVPYPRNRLAPPHRG